MSKRYQVVTKGNLDCRVLDLLEDAGPMGRTSLEIGKALRAPKSRVLAALALLDGEGCVHGRHGLWFYGGAP